MLWQLLDPRVQEPKTRFMFSYGLQVNPVDGDEKHVYYFSLFSAARREP